MTVQPDSVRRAEPDLGLLLQQPKKEITVSKKKPKYQPKQQTSVVVRKKPKGTPFKDALEKAGSHRGRPSFKLQEIINALGDEYHLFIESCCSRSVTTQALAHAIRSIGVHVSYSSMLKIRKQIEAENKWFYEMVQDIVSNGGSEPNSLTDTNYNDDKYWAMESPIEQ